MIFGQDDSEFQGPRTVEHYRQQGFVILRADSGYRADNWIAYNLPVVKQSGVPWGAYLYLVPDRDVAGQVQRMLRTVGEDPPLGYWIDYEQVGLTSSHLQAGFAALDAAHVRESGYYSNAVPATGDPYFSHKPFLNRPWWYAAYPGRNDGTFPGLPPRTFARPVQLWQFSSTNGTQDVSVVVDEPWFAHGAPIPPAPPSSSSWSENMIVFAHNLDGSISAFEETGGNIVRQFSGAPGAYKIPQDAIDFAGGVIPIREWTWPMIDAGKKAWANAQTAPSSPPPAPAPHEVTFTGTATVG